MKKFMRRQAIQIMPLLITAVFGLSACSKSTPPVAAPPPVASPAPGVGGGYYGGGCGAVGGVSPLRQDGQPFYSTLTSQYYQGSSSNSLALTLLYASGYYADQNQTNIVGSGTFSFPDLNMLSGGGASSPTTSFCVSSASISGGSPTPGAFAPGSKEIAITLQGLAQVALPNYYYTGAGVSYAQQIVNVTVGTGSYSCQAFLYSGRIVGCVQVSIGNNGQRLPYQAQ